ncbi:maestro heat-like repeat-containing protein family member 1 isoform X3 [Paramormyrops kingsleyae]|uniref:maestro heat-like repeat-containing protein family member 1 isoform X3 n=1 Tax=Paramormyrops kingsleyae TaxID=1676925 RepID=UPI003B97191E
MEESDIEEASQALIEAANDRDPMVQEQVRKSMLTLGKRKPDRVLPIFQNYLLKHPKLPVAHRVAVLQTIELILLSRIDEIGCLRVKSIVSLASDEMTRSKEVVPDWQQAASNILVAVGNKHMGDIMEEMLSKFQPGVLPHFFVVQTLARLAHSNVYGMVPFLSAILTTMLPMLGMAKQDNMKWVFSFALSRFSESIVEYLANLDKAPDPTVSKATFSGEIYAAYDILFCNWLQSRESKVRLTVTEALGAMTLLMARDKLEEQLPKLIPALLNLYKKTPDHYIISKSLCQVLDAAASTDGRLLRALADSLLLTLHQQVSLPVDYNSPGTVKNHNEILRCFSILADTFPDRLVIFVLQRLENGGERNRVGSLAVLRHLVNTSSSIMDTKKGLIVTSLRLPLLDTSNKVKKKVVQVISAIAHHGYLELEGGDMLLRFMMLHCALPDACHGRSLSDQEEVTNEALRNICEKTLHLLATTVGRMEDVLWPALLRYLTPVQYADATVPLCSSLVLLGNRKRVTGDPGYIVDFTKQDSLPSPYSIMVRLWVNASYPFRSRGRGAPSLRLLAILAPNTSTKFSIYIYSPSLQHPKGSRVCETPPGTTLTPVCLCVGLPESTVDTLNRRTWEQSLLKLLSKTLVAVMDAGWCCRLVSEMSLYLPTYNGSLDEKSFLYKCMGVTLQRCCDSGVVKEQLRIILATACHSEAIEREGVAKGIGLCASNHLDDTLAKLDDFARSDAFRKASGILGLLKDKNDGDVEKMKSTLILSYGYIALHAPEDKVLGRIDSQILRNISKHFSTKVLGMKVETKDLTLKISLLQSVGLIAQAIGACVRRQNYLFARKQELVGGLMDIIKAEPADVLVTSVRHLAMTACASLVNLDPALTETETCGVLQTCLNSVLGLPPLEVVDRGEEDESLDLQQRQGLYAETFSALEDLLGRLLSRNLTPDGLQSIFKHLEVWMGSELDHGRERAVRTATLVLDSYLHNLAVRQKTTTFHNIGALLGRLVPRCTDRCSAVSWAAGEGLRILLRIQLRYEGFPPEHRDAAVDNLPTLYEGLRNPDPAALCQTCSHLAEAFSRRLTPQQVGPLILVLTEGLRDPQPSCCLVSGVFLNTLLMHRGGRLQDLVPEIMGALHLGLQAISEDQVKTAVAHSILTLASQHLQVVIDTLISYPLPYDSSTCDMWMALGGHSALAGHIVETFTERLVAMVPYTEKRDPALRMGATKVATVQPLAVTCALREIMMNGQIEAAVTEQFPRLFVALLVRMGSSVGVQLPKDICTGATRPEKRPSGKVLGAFDVCGMALEAMQILLVRAQLDEVLKTLDLQEGWAKMKEPQQFIDGIALLANAMATHAGPRLPAIIQHLYPTLTSIYECQRTTATAFLSELLNHRVATEMMMTDSLMKSMIARLADPCGAVRMLAIRGLGNIATGSPEKVIKYAMELLAALSSGMEESDDPSKRIALEAMSGLSKVLLHLNKNAVRMLLVYILMKIKPFLESEYDTVRCAAVLLLGNLSKFGSGEPVFRDQIHNVLMSLLLHLSDPSPDVVKACKLTLQECVPLLGSKLIATMFQNHLYEDRNLHYGEFINDLMKYIIQDFPGMLNFYHTTILQFFKSTWTQVRASAAMFTGFLLGNLPREFYPHMNIGNIINGLIQLLGDPDPTVRAKAAEAMGHFRHFHPASGSGSLKELDVSA